MKLIRSRPTAVVAAALTVALMAAGCGGSDSSTSAPKPTGAASAASGAQDAAEIDFLTFQSPNLTAQFWEDQVAAVQKDYPNLKVNLLYTPGLDRQGYAKQLLASGQLPDVIWDVPLQDFVAADALLPYSDTDLGDIDAPADAGAIDGEHYSLTLGAQTIPMMYYNKTMFADLGVEVPATWDELTAAAEKIKAAGETAFLLGGGSDSWTSSILLDGIIDADVYSQTPDWMDQRKAGDVSFTDDDMRTAVTKWASLIKDGYTNDDALSLGYDQLSAKFAAGEGAMYPMGSWAGTTKADFEVGVFAIPTDDGSTVISQNFGQALAISAKTEFPDQARAFAVELATSVSAATAQLTSDSLIPTVKGYEIPADVTPLIRETVELYNSADATYVKPFGWAQGGDASPSGFDTAFSEAAQKVISGGSVDDFLEEADRQFDDLNTQ
jgi:ABC-type glycerol-3-phosphate transport system substrate-binding protein